MKKKIIYTGVFISILPIIFFWLQGSFSLFGSGLPSVILALGRLYGLLAVYFVLWQFLLMGRSTFLEREFGLDVLSRIHQRNGKIAITFILLHPLFIILSYSLMGKIGIFEQILEFITDYEDLLGALLAVGLFGGVVGASLFVVRKRLRYEVWYFVHLLTYIAVIFAWGHQIELGGDFLQSSLFKAYWYGLYAFVFGLLFFYRFFLPILRSIRHGFYISDVIPETDSAVSYYISGKNMKQFPVRPGQFMIFRFLTKGLWHEAHPFSLSQANDGTTIRITAKKAGDFTKKLPHTPKGTRVIIDGPYGIFTAQKAKTKKILLLAGGVGITPMRSLIEQFGKEGKNMILLYQNRTEHDIVFLNELEELRKRFGFQLVHIISDSKTFQGERGTISEHRIRQFAPDFLERDIYFCGSPNFLKVVMHDLKRLGVKKRLMHYEQFSFHFSST